MVALICCICFSSFVVPVFLKHGSFTQRAFYPDLQVRIEFKWAKEDKVEKEGFPDPLPSEGLTECPCSTKTWEGIGKSIPNVQEISRDPRGISRNAGNLVYLFHCCLSHRDKLVCCIGDEVAI